jgi:hypothetical protein
MAKMKKSIVLKIGILLMIGLMLLLSYHTHPPLSPGDGDDDHCLLCQILHTGFTFSLSFEFSALLILIEIIFLSQTLIEKILPQTGFDYRAPPFMLLFN